MCESKTLGQPDWPDAMDCTGTARAEQPCRRAEPAEVAVDGPTAQAVRIVECGMARAPDGMRLGLSGHRPESRAGRCAQHSPSPAQTTRRDACDQVQAYAREGRRRHRMDGQHPAFPPSRLILC